MHKIESGAKAAPGSNKDAVELRESELQNVYGGTETMAYGCTTDKDGAERSTTNTTAIAGGNIAKNYSSTNH